MRNRVSSNSPRNLLSIMLILLLALLFVGCGGGGGGGGNQGNNNNNNNNGGGTPPGNPALATITGVVKDTSPIPNPVQGALVTIIVPGGPNRTATTDATGTFVVTNVALTASTFQVASPNVQLYFNYANYNGKLYDLINCVLPLPKLVAGANSPFTTINMYVGGNNPPPPPPVGGCPS